VQQAAETPLGQAETVPWRDVEVAHADFPGSLERGVRFLVGMLVELVT
jgi:hypothetical protein